MYNVQITENVHFTNDGRCTMLYNLQCTNNGNRTIYKLWKMSNVKYTMVYNVQLKCTMYNVQCWMYNVEYTLCPRYL